MNIEWKIYCDKCGDEIPTDEGKLFFEVKNKRGDTGSYLISEFVDGSIVTTDIKIGLSFRYARIFQKAIEQPIKIAFIQQGETTKILCAKCAKKETK